MLDEAGLGPGRRARGVIATLRVEQGEVLPSILAAARRRPLLVVGAHGWNPLRDLILGSTAERLLGQVPPCPSSWCGARRAGTTGASSWPWTSPPTRSHALAMAMRIAPGADIVLVHAFGIPFEGRLRLAGVDDERLREYRAQARHQALSRDDRDGGLDPGRPHPPVARRGPRPPAAADPREGAPASRGPRGHRHGRSAARPRTSSSGA